MTKEDRLKNMPSGLDAIFGNSVEEQVEKVKKSKAKPTKSKKKKVGQGDTVASLNIDLSAAAPKRKEYTNFRIDKQLHARLTRIAELENLKSGPALA
ncbi:MAG: hypothetical protein AAF696_15815, partial [Bacteroidota bacterium]